LSTRVVFNVIFVVAIEVKVIFWLTTSRRVDGDEAIAHRLSSEAVNVLLIHSIIASRLVSSRELLYIVQDDHDRDVTARIPYRFCSTLAYALWLL